MARGLAPRGPQGAIRPRSQAPKSRPPSTGSWSTSSGRRSSSRSRPGASARPGRKLERLVASHRVLLVHPITVEKWLVVVDEEGAVIRRRRSPSRGLPLDLFDELVHIPGLIADENLRIEFALTCEEEIRGPVPAGARYRYPRAWRRLDRRLVKVVETRRIDTAEDLRRLLPLDVPDRFTTRDIVAASGRSKRLAMSAVYCLERSGAVARVARRGRFVEYSRPAEALVAEG